MFFEARHFDVEMLHSLWIKQLFHKNLETPDVSLFGNNNSHFVNPSFIHSLNGLTMCQLSPTNNIKTIID